jgi:hypothetical protein
MKLSKEELIIKFPQLEKFSNQKWLSDEAIKPDCNYKELPLKATFEMIKELLNFIEKTKFSSNWEMGFSVKNRIKQIESLLSHFCDNTIEEQAIKGTNLESVPTD